MFNVRNIINPATVPGATKKTRGRKPRSGQPNQSLTKSTANTPKKKKEKKKKYEKNLKLPLTEKTTKNNNNNTNKKQQTLSIHELLTSYHKQVLTPVLQKPLQSQKKNADKNTRRPLLPRQQIYSILPKQRYAAAQQIYYKLYYEAEKENEQLPFVLLQHNFCTNKSETNALQYNESFQNALLLQNKHILAKLSWSLESCCFDFSQGLCNIYRDYVTKVIYNLNFCIHVDILNTVLAKYTPHQIVQLDDTVFTTLYRNHLPNENQNIDKQQHNNNDIDLQNDNVSIRCQNCHGKNISFRQLQTRGADEAMTSFFTCQDCGKNWKVY